MTTVSMNFKADKDTKLKFDKVANQLGISSSALLNLFVTRVARDEAIPFKVEVTPDKSMTLDDESLTEMVKVMAIEKVLIPDDGTEITDVDKYFKGLGY